MMNMLHLAAGDEGIKLDTVAPKLRVPVGGGARHVRHVITKVGIKAHI